MEATAKPYKMRRRPTALTPEQQALAAEAWSCVEVAVMRLDRKFPAACISAEVACRITRLIPTFDPRRSSLRTWAGIQARGAIRDAQRGCHPAGARRRPSKHGTISLADLVLDPAVTHDPPSEWVEMEAARHLLRGLRPDERDSVLCSIVGEETVAAIGARHGVSESRASQLRTAALAWLRAARARERDTA